MKTAIQSVLRQLGIYHRLRASRLYDFYWTVANPALLRSRRLETQLYRSLLRSDAYRPLIFDVGANEGFKTGIFLGLGARVISVDPDLRNQKILEDSFLRLRLFRKSVTIVKKAVSNVVGESIFWIEEPGSAKNTLSEKWVDTLRNDEARFGSSLSFENQCTVPTTTLDALITQFGKPDYIKIDVEGHEPEVIQGLSQKVPLLSFEVNLPEFLSEGIECIRILENIQPSGQFNYVADSDCQAGLVLDSWVDRRHFEELLGKLDEPSIEIFWRTCV